MKTTISFHEFVEGFRTSSYYNSFTREALVVMFDFYEDLEDDIGCEIEYDVCAMHEDWRECTFDELLNMCGIDAGAVDPDDVDFAELGGIAYWVSERAMADTCKLIGGRVLVYLPLLEHLEADLFNAAEFPC